MKPSSDPRKDLPQDASQDAATRLSRSYAGHTSFSADQAGTLDVSSDVLIHREGRGSESWAKDGEEGAATTEAAEERKKSRLDTEAAREFASLIDQAQDSPGVSGEHSDGHASRVSLSPKTPPSKPLRRKKPSDSSIGSFEDGDTEATLQASTTAGNHSAPGTTSGLDRDLEVEEEEIRPSFMKRDLLTGSDNIELISVEPRETAGRSPSPTGFVNISLTSVTSDPASREGGVVDEDLIEASVTSRDAQAARDKSGNRVSSEGRERKKKKEKEPKKPALDDEELERLIAMNAFPPGSQGWAGIMAGGMEGGVHDEFMPREALQQLPGSRPHAARQNSSDSSEASSSLRFRNQRTGGVAFEVRDDVVTGRPVSVDITRSRSRNSSASPSRSSSRDRMSRPSSAHDVLHHHHHHVPQLQSQRQGGREDKENREDGLDWSGKRLVRSGSFPEIPQDDSISDWTDKNRINDDDEDVSTSTTSSKRPSAAIDAASHESDAEADPAARPLPPRDVFKARENLASLSDLSVSNSISSSRSSSPAQLTNGPGGGGGGGTVSAPGVAGVKTSGSAGAVVGVTAVSDGNANSKSLTVTLRHASAEEDMDC